MYKNSSHAVVRPCTTAVAKWGKKIFSQQALNKYSKKIKRANGI